ncbi:peptidase M15 [Paenibacillus sp. 32O-W]|uniref:M15 family metallopeptidase n=1 Tax=Paenibacillus sp. 32O-W TaxID=1695218 RepID=UPI00071FE98E|nr:M15 family metallopeptidase [Paenibacillus sp. 32O-W]ALS28246.1 peptidase M15 [Paenibacillus sp. 32O-W]
MKKGLILFLFTSLVMLSAGCGSLLSGISGSHNVGAEQTQPNDPAADADDATENEPSKPADAAPEPPERENAAQEHPGTDKPDAKPEKPPVDKPNSPPEREGPVQETAGKIGDLMVVANPDSLAVLINKQYTLPENYEPEDLVYPDVPFIFSEKVDKRKLRKEAAEALEKLFAGAKEDGIELAGVSGYRSYERQKELFESYVKRDGEEKARTYSALPGTSEHQTGLSIDVSGSDGRCAAQDCFAGTPEAEWLAEHAAEYGFIIRYPKGKEDITGYKYEPWHIRYVGLEIAKEIAERDITLEEYYQAVPVSGK